ncbi:MAG: metallophosphoesterase [Methanoregulaceae archaeon]|nr:metallophosphoesterase [Methanoregulaceae archaeon]
MGLELKIPKLPKIGVYHYLSIILFIGLVNTSVGYAYFEARSTEITVLHIEGASENIVFIADPHLKNGNIGHTRTIVNEINTLHPSIVLIGGDFVYGEGENLSLQKVWSEIDAPVYAVLGNHDYKSGVTVVTWAEKCRIVGASCFDVNGYDASFLKDSTTDFAYADQVTAELEKNNVTVLRNEYVTSDVGGKELVIVGIDDGWAGMADPPEVPEFGAFTIYMIHEPDCRADWNADLILAGHTHGGQFVPQNTPIPGFDLSGLVERNGVQTYITRGIGTSNLGIELRLFATPEIVIINPTEPPEHIFPDKNISHIFVDE